MNQILTSTPLRDAIYAMALAKPHTALRLGSKFIFSTVDV